MGDRTERALGLETTAAGPAPGAKAEALYGDELGAGALVGEYVIDEKRARGGFGVVYRAHHQHTGRQVALKVLHAHLATSPTMLKRFQREIETVSSLEHANIVAVLDCGALPQGRPFFAMEWVEGHTLDEELRARGPLTPAELVQVLGQLCGALSAAHEQGVVHRDLKASNVLVIPSGMGFQLKLVDFGVAKLSEGDPASAGLTSTGARIGTPHTMAPEQIMSQPVDVRTDVYAMGVFIYHALTGQYPFTADSALEVEDMHLNRPPPRVSEHAPVPAALDAVVLRCLEKQKERRYPTVAAVLADLRASLMSIEDVRTERPSGRFGAIVGRGLGLHVEVRVDPRATVGGDDDALLDAMAELLDAARAECTGAGLHVAIEGGNSFLAVAMLPTDASAAALDRRERLRLALNLAYALPPPADTRVQLTVIAHVASVTMLAVEPTPQFVAGDLLGLGDWASGATDEPLRATGAALEGLEDAFELGPAEPTGTRKIIAAR